ncbi:MAG TPA: right-handed parallel beta-helix repeat-containing protein, partial [bacterium]|nr:right-handed parallel beta-helix repeat-containing protein [bacterium]
MKNTHSFNAIFKSTGKRKIYDSRNRALLILLLLVTACLSGQNQCLADTYVGGWITSDEIWSPSGNPYIAINKINISENVTLTLQPGVEIRFDNDTGICAHGDLCAVGTSENQIVFTSNQVSPAPGDWDGIEAFPSSNASGLEHCIVEYGDSANLGFVLFWGSSSAIFRNNIFRYGAQAGISIHSDNAIIENNEIHDFDSTGLTINGFSPTVTSNFVHDCGLHGMYIYRAGPSTLIADNQIDNCSGFPIHGFGVMYNNRGSGNGIRAISLPIMNICGTLNLDNDWMYVSQHVTVPENETLTIEPGVVLKIMGGNTIRVEGSIISEGTSDNPIVITSEHDDSFGGDTFNDGNTTIPAPNDWGGLLVFDSGGSSVLRYTIIQYGSTAGMDSMVFWGDRNGLIEHNIFRWGGEGALYCDLEGSVVQFNEVCDFPLTGITCAEPPERIANNSVDQCGFFGIRILLNSPYSLIAQNCIENCGMYPIEGFGEMLWNEGSGNEISAIKLPDEELTGTLYRENGWVYATEGFSIPPDGMLHIEPGTIIKMEGNGIISNGKLIAEGTDINPIIFTSQYDDNYGGDTYHDLSSTLPSPGDWSGLKICGSGSILSNCRAFFGGAVGKLSMIHWLADPGLIKDCIFSDGGYSGVYIEAHNTVLSNCIAHSFQG